MGKAPNGGSEGDFWPEIRDGLDRLSSGNIGRPDLCKLLGAAQRGYVSMDMLLQRMPKNGLDWVDRDTRDENGWGPGIVE
jgi:hypothetical protein